MAMAMRRISEEMSMRRLGVGLLLVVLGSGGIGCANLTPRQQRALSGGAIGAAGGAAGGGLGGGSPAIGAALGRAGRAATGGPLKKRATPQPRGKNSCAMGGVPPRRPPH